MSRERTEHTGAHTTPEATPERKKGGRGGTSGRGKQGNRGKHKGGVLLPQAHGVLLVYKPAGMGSTSCLEKIKHGLGQKKIGHAGTLDPMAEGLLVVLLGQGTKIAQHLLTGEKAYYGEAELGYATDTYDAEGEVVSRSGLGELTEADVRAEVEHWRTLDRQDVPPYSAAKHKGTPLYKLAREGKEAPRKEKDVTIFGAEVVAIDLPRLSFRTAVSAGTYIRSLVHSLGMRLGCGATLTRLVREKSLPFSLEDAHPLDAILAEPDAFASRVMPLEAALPHWPTLTATADQAAMVRNGGRLPHEGTLALPGTPVPGAHALIVDEAGRALALVEIAEEAGSPVWAITRGLWSA